MWAKKLIQRGGSPGRAPNNSQAPSKAPTAQPSKGPASQANALAKQLPQWACDGKGQPRDKQPPSPNQAASQRGLSAEPKVKGQVQKPQSVSKPVYTHDSKLVSASRRCRSHSPSHRLEVVDGWVGGDGRQERMVKSQECLVVPSQWNLTSVDHDFLSSSFPPPSPASRSSRFLQVHHQKFQCSLSSQDLRSTSPVSPSPGSVPCLVSLDDTVVSLVSPLPHLIQLHPPLPLQVVGQVLIERRSCSPYGSPFGSRYVRPIET